jgi:copper chaperone CopZ
VKRLLSILVAVLVAPAAAAKDVNVQYRLTGLFQPDRADDLRRQAGTLTINDGDSTAKVKLVNVDYESSVVTFAYDADSKPFKDKNPRQVHEQISGLLRHVSRGSFDIHALGTFKPGRLRQERIAIAGLDCKGCAYGAYRAIAMIDGVERAVVSFKDGHVTAWIEPAKTSRKALVGALKNAQVDVIEPETAAVKPAAKP